MQEHGNLKDPALRVFQVTHRKFQIFSADKNTGISKARLGELVEICKLRTSGSKNVEVSRVTFISIHRYETIRILVRQGSSLAHIKVTGAC